MKVLLFVLLAVTTVSFSGKAQAPGATDHLKQQSRKMVDALLKGDYRTFASYTYPKIVKSLGGAAQMEAILSKSMNSMKANGTTFSHISLDEPSRILRTGKELQATITQHTEIKVGDEKMMIISTLVGISSDDGNNWTFVDASNKDKATLQKALPNLNPALVIPAEQAPVRIN